MKRANLIAACAAMAVALVVAIGLSKRADMQGRGGEKLTAQQNARVEKSASESAAKVADREDEGYSREMTLSAAGQAMLSPDLRVQLEEAREIVRSARMSSAPRKAAPVGAGELGRDDLMQLARNTAANYPERWQSKYEDVYEDFASRYQPGSGPEAGQGGGQEATTPNQPEDFMKEVDFEEAVRLRKVYDEYLSRTPTAREEYEARFNQIER